MLAHGGPEMAHLRQLLLANGSSPGVLAEVAPALQALMQAMQG